MGEATTFFEAIFAPMPDDYWLYIWTLPSRRTTWCKNIEDAVRVSERLRDTENVYVGMSYAPKIFRDDKGRAEYARCSADDSAGIPALWAEVDFGNERQGLFVNEKDALEFIDSFSASPTMVVKSGHGFHIYWCFREPWTFDGPGEHKEATVLTYRWKETIKSWAAREGKRVDSVSDLARVMRVPGTYNYKYQGDTVFAKDCKNPIPVTIVSHDDDVRYNPHEFDAYLIDVKMPSSPDGFLEDDASDFVINLDATPPEPKFTLLCDLDPSVSLSYYHRRDDQPNWSPSEYDMSLARYAAQVKWTNQEIVDLIISSRRMNGCDIKEHRSYYETTIKKARRDKNYEIAERKVDIVEVELETEKKTSQEQKKILQALLGVDIEWIVKYETEPAQYRICIGGKVKLLNSVDHITSQAKFRRIVAELASKNFKSLSAAKWNAVSNILLAMAAQETEDFDGELNEIGMLRQWIRGYLNATPPDEGDDVALSIEVGTPVIDDQERICVFLPNFANWLHITRTGDASTRQLAASMQEDGWMRTTLTWEDSDGKTSSRTAWAKPKYVVASDYLKQERSTWAELSGVK